MRGIRCTGLDGASYAGMAFDVFGAGQAVSGVAQAAASLAGATIQANATKEAAKLATDSANRSADMVQKRYDTTRGDLLPYQETGQQAQQWEQGNFGVYNYYGGDETAAMRRDMPGRTLNGVQVATPQDFNALPSIAQYSTVPGSMSQAELEATPGYKFNLSQGLGAVQNSASARGLGVSGAAMKGAATFATGLADSTYKTQFDIAQTRFQDQFNKDSQLFGQAQSIFGDQLSRDQQNFGQQSSRFEQQMALGQGQFGQSQQIFANDQNIGQFDQSSRTAAANRLYQLSSLGANAAAQTGQLGAYSANAAGNYLTAGASGAGAGLIAGGNAISGGLNGITNAFSQYQQNQQIQKYLDQKSGSSGGSAFDGPGYDG